VGLVLKTLEKCCSHSSGGILNDWFGFCFCLCVKFFHKSPGLLKIFSEKLERIVALCLSSSFEKRRLVDKRIWFTIPVLGRSQSIQILSQNTAFLLVIKHVK
jgi:hypothetical protein